MKLCQNEEELYRLGQDYLSGQVKIVRALDNRLLCWAFITVLAFMYGCFFGNIFFFFDVLCSAYFMGWAVRQRMHAGKTELNITVQGQEGKHSKLSLEERARMKQDGFLLFFAWLFLVFLGMLFIACFFQTEGMRGYRMLYGKVPVICAATLLLLKEGAYQIGYREQGGTGFSIVSGYRYSQLTTVCTLLACLLSNLKQGDILPYILLTTYLFDIILLCPVFKKNIFP